MTMKTAHVIRFAAAPSRRSAVCEALTTPSHDPGLTLRFGPARFGVLTWGLEAAAPTLDRVAPLLDGPPAVNRLDIVAEKLPVVGPEAAQPTAGLLLTFRVRRGRGAEAAAFLREARGIVDDEPDTTAWFGFASGSDVFGILDVFPHRRARRAHLAGRLPAELARGSRSFLGSVPQIRLMRVLGGEWQAEPSAVATAGN